MDEAKPTGPKPKWWSRPATGPAAEAVGPPPVLPEAPERTEPVAPETAPVPEAPAPLADGPATVVPEVPGPRTPGAVRPLHEPDEYSTPPYGGPGPWAPAPPVQHPAATPAHGTPVPASYAAPPGAPHPAEPHAHQHAPHQHAPHQHAPHQHAPHQHGHAPHQAPAQTAPWLHYDPWGSQQEPLTRTAPHASGVIPVAGRRGGRRGSLLVGAVLLALVAGVIGGGVGAYVERNGGLTTVHLPQAGAAPAGRAPDSVAGIAASALPGVVTLHVSGSEESGTGTGFVLDGEGHILTNNHVVAPAGSSGDITVTFSGGENARAEVVGTDSGYDLAVVKVSGVSGLKPLTLGNSDNVAVGDPVVAIGAPYDLSNTVTSGIISAKQRPITAGGEEAGGSDVSYVDALQTDAPINPGNSGGPLLDAHAQVIGINSAIRAADTGATETGAQAGSIGLGFAIPINQGKRVAEELINTGKATHPVIGVTLDMEYTGDGAKVNTEGADGSPAVTEDGPGDRAGVRPGDVITAVDGVRVHNGEELIVKIRAHRPGDRLGLRLTRGGKELSMTLTLGSATGS
ncbi:S1C family serine protease [Streptomyces sp. NBC_00102]|uniref:S1C family serine protease n=1 Tax=Streptomyces sp. NBC_00102 TaxID=2975652 RepID=UPI00224F10C4|nr:trypsin-like peptidase domain-containing protein [Streptomyces sp. NBC_00102]MCX5399556.1 trypsin-like peptidase domain-containing protein [Streptomyces sp. NBC_00102]